MFDSLQRFLFVRYPIRGAAVILHKAWKDSCQGHAYPTEIDNLIGEAMAANALMASILKFDGSISLELRNSKCLPLLLSQSRSNRTLRAMAKVECLESYSYAERSADAQLLISIEPEGEHRYQGMVNASAESLSKTVEGYFLQSEQLNTKLINQIDSNFSLGLFLQQMPETDQEELNPFSEDIWLSLQKKIESIPEAKQTEAFASLSALIAYIFPDEPIHFFQEENLRFQCSCSRATIGKIILSLGVEEARQILKEQGSIEVRCDFCNAAYSFGESDIHTLFGHKTI